MPEICQIFTHLSCLQCIVLSGFPFTETVGSSLPVIDSLTALGLQRAGLTDATCIAVASRFPKLRHLDLFCNSNLTLRGIQFLSDKLVDLVELDVAGTHVNISDLARFLDSDAPSDSKLRFPKLRRLHVMSIYAAMKVNRPSISVNTGRGFAIWH